MNNLSAIGQLPKDHPPVLRRKIGVLLVNLGTPEGTSYWPMRAYLKEFLSDPRVIEVNRAVWWVVLNVVILTFRPTKSGHAYAQIWNKEKNESPLKTITRAMTEKVTAALQTGDELVVDWAMRYGKPAIADRMKALKDQGCDRILVFPLYPQYSAATTATVMDKVYETLRGWRWQPAMRSVPPYFDHPAHIEAVGDSLVAHMKTLAWKPDMVLLSFHGLPREYLTKGDPYHCHCMKTARLLRERLGYSAEEMKVVFQSRFGPREWLQPYAQETVEALPSQGVKKLLMISPGFASDCVETLEELAIGLEETFKEKGGEEFSVVPCLNDSARSIDMLAALVRQELKGWRD